MKLQWHLAEDRMPQPTFLIQLPYFIQKRNVLRGGLNLDAEYNQVVYK